MADVEMLLPPDPSPPVSVFDQFFLRQKAKRGAIVQFCTDFFFVIFVIHYYIRFVIPYSCPPNAENCTHYDLDFKGIWNNTNLYGTAKNSLSGRDKALLIAAITILIKFAVIIESFSTLSIFDKQSLESDLKAAKLTRNYYVLRVSTSMVEVIMHFIGGISLMATTPIAVVRLVFFVYPLAQLVYVLDALWCYFIMMVAMAECMQGSYSEQLQIIEVVDVEQLEIIV